MEREKGELLRVLHQVEDDIHICGVNAVGTPVGHHSVAGIRQRKQHGVCDPRGDGKLRGREAHGRAQPQGIPTGNAAKPHFRRGQEAPTVRRDAPLYVHKAGAEHLPTNDSKIQGRAEHPLNITAPQTLKRDRFSVSFSIIFNLSLTL